MRTPLALFFAGWLLVCGGGLYALSAKSAENAPNATAPATWPVSARVPNMTGRPMLVLFAHSRCACTRATIRELERLLARAKDKPDTWIVLAGPAGEGPISIRAAAQSVAGAHVIEDDGTEAARFGTKASGQVLIYGRDRRLAFNGGITPARGHEGDSRGADLALRALDPRVAPPSSVSSSASADVFGCGIATKEP
jgi:hypothetical protein